MRVLVLGGGPAEATAALQPEPEYVVRVDSTWGLTDVRPFR
jgi:hypothetical protein